MKTAILEIGLNDDGQPKKRRRVPTAEEAEARRKLREARRKAAEAAAEFSSDPEDEDFDDSLPVSGLNSESETDSDVDAEMSNEEVGTLSK
jgi:parvulin-like peptidyl-prolyl isomerase